MHDIIEEFRKHGVHVEIYKTTIHELIQDKMHVAKLLGEVKTEEDCMR